MLILTLAMALKESTRQTSFQFDDISQTVSVMA